MVLQTNSKLVAMGMSSWHKIIYGFSEVKNFDMIARIFHIAGSFKHCSLWAEPTYAFDHHSVEKSLFASHAGMERTMQIFREIKLGPILAKT